MEIYNRQTQQFNKVSISQTAFIPQGDKMIPVAQAKRRFFIPEYARFKCGVWWADSGKCSPFPSYECAKNMTEEQGFYDLIRRVVKGKNPDTYTTIGLYMAETNNLAIAGKNHNYEICIYAAGLPIRTERKIIFYPDGKVNVQATIDANK